MTVIDADSHLYEQRSLWADHTDASRRELALRIVDDDLGYPWLCLGDRRIEVLGIHEPGDTGQSGEFRERLRTHAPNTDAAYDDMPSSYWDPSARLAVLDRDGIDEAVLLPNCGIMWERALEHDLEATTVNMSAWNRWAAEVAQTSNRLHPVGHVTLRDLDWLERELAALDTAGVRLAMLSPALVDGRRPSHPSHERAWSAFEHHGIAPVFHIAQYPMPFDDAWNEDDPDWSNPVLSSVFMWTAPAIVLADLAVRGVFARHPALRVGVIELMSAWLPQFLLMLDGGFRFHATFNGRPLTEMELTPSDYVRRQVRVASFPFEKPHRLAELAGDVFMFGSDFPHPEGLADPVEEFVAKMGVGPDDAPSFFAGNAAWLLGR